MRLLRQAFRSLPPKTTTKLSRIVEKTLLPFQTTYQAAFGLVELAIVIVVIGFLTTTVLYGTDLLASSRLSNFTKQIRQIQEGVELFKVKFGALPGDINYLTAQRYGLFSWSWANPGTTGRGNQDGRITDSSGGKNRLGEVTMFWRHLNDAGYISYPLLTVGTVPKSNYETAAPGTQYLPTMVEAIQPTNRSTGFIFFSVFYTANSATLGGGHFITVGRLSFIDNATTGVLRTFAGGHLLQLDRKIDDGYPLSGMMYSASRTNDANSQGDVNGECLNGSNYNTDLTVAANGANGCAFILKLF